MNMRRIFSLLIACLALSLSVSAQSPREVQKYSAEYMREIYDKIEVDIPMRDGVKLRTEIYEPKDKSVKHPVMMERTCYGVGPYGPDRFANFRGEAKYVDAGYIFVFQDVRGKNMSEGDFEDIRPFVEGKKLSRKSSRNVGQTDEASDTYDTVEWVIRHTNNNGCVGQKGISYPGFYATMGALSGHPAMKAVSPQAPVTDWWTGDDVHHNGALMLGEMFSFLPWFEYAASNKFVRAGKSYSDLKFPQFRRNDIYTDYLQWGTVGNMTRAYGDSLSYMRIVREHPDWDEYWESHTVTRGHMHDVKPAVMVVGGLFDKEDCYGAFDTYKAIREQSPQTDLYLVEGPWFHGGWSRGMGEVWGSMYFGPEAVSSYYVDNIEYPFFAYYLEGKGEKPQTGAMVFDSGSRKWNFYSAGWPQAGLAEMVPFYLGADGSVGTERPSAKGAVSYVSDPAKPVPYRDGVDNSISMNYMVDDQRFASRRPDVLCFQTDALDEAVSIAGEIVVDLDVDITTTDADFIVKVIDVFPDGFSWYSELGIPQPWGRASREQQGQVKLPSTIMGGYQFMVRGDVLRGKYRDSFSSPEPFVPGEVTRVRYRLNDVCHTFKPGHKIMIQIQSSWFPLVDRNPQTFCDIYTCDESAFVKSTITVHCGGDSASAVYLPVVK